MARKCGTLKNNLHPARAAARAEPLENSIPAGLTPDKIHTCGLQEYGVGRIENRLRLAVRGTAECVWIHDGNSQREQNVCPHSVS